MLGTAGLKYEMPPVEKQDFICLLLQLRADVLQTVRSPTAESNLPCKVEKPCERPAGDAVAEKSPWAKNALVEKDGSSKSVFVSLLPPNLAPPASVVEPSRLAIAQCVKVRIEHSEELISENTYEHWGVVIFNTLKTGDFDLEVTMLADAPYTDPWHNWMVIGAVPSGTSARQLSCADSPWNWGCFLTPFTAPMEIWSGSMGRANQIPKCPSVPSRLRSGQTLRVCCTAGRMSFGVDKAPTALLPSNLQRKEPMMPCMILGLQTRVVVARLFTEQEFPAAWLLSNSPAAWLH